jgi:hypothetical protein
MLNTKKDQWQFIKHGYPKFGEEVFALVEPDVIIAPEDGPFILTLVCEEGSYVKWRVPNFDPEHEEEYVNTNALTLVAWRYK